jgi:hypothetical protein
MMNGYLFLLTLLAAASVKEIWKRLDRAFHRGEELPPVSLYKVGDFYFVLDGHHRLSLASYHGVEWIDVEVTEFGTAGLRSDRRDRDSLTHGMEIWTWYLFKGGRRRAKVAKVKSL